MEESKKNLGPKEVNTWVDSTPVTLNIHKSPVQTTLETGELTMHPDATAELPVSVARSFGFADAVQVELTMPDAVKGASVDPVELAKDQTTGVLKITSQGRGPGRSPLYRQDKA